MNYLRIFICFALSGVAWDMIRFMIHDFALISITGKIFGFSLILFSWWGMYKIIKRITW